VWDSFFPSWRERRGYCFEAGATAAVRVGVVIEDDEYEDNSNNSVGIPLLVLVHG
jgi:hypothetical protein